MAALPIPPTAAGGPPGAAAPVPPGLGGSPPNLGGATMPQSNPGNAAAALMKVHQAVNLLQEALPAIPMGSELHIEALEIIKRILKALPEKQDPSMAGPQQANLLQMIRQNSQQAPQAALARLNPAQGGQPPAMPQAA